jgi:hypothetical protein
VNCGTQNLIDEYYKPTDKCFHCYKPIGLKVDKAGVPIALPPAKLKEKEAPMNQGVNLEDLPPETRDNIKDEVLKTLAPVPPKPDTSGLTLLERNNALHDYYEANKPQILHELDLVGEEQTIKRWGFSATGWKHARHRWIPERFPPPPKRVKKGKKTKAVAKKTKEATKKSKLAPRAVPETLEEAEEVCINCPVLNALKGYRLAVVDILGSLKKKKGA